MDYFSLFTPQGITPPIVPTTINPSHPFDVMSASPQWAQGIAQIQQAMHPSMFQQLAPTLGAWLQGMGQSMNKPPAPMPMMSLPAVQAQPWQMLHPMLQWAMMNR